MKILLIEDEQEMSRTLSEALLEERYIVETALTFADALEKIGIYNYDCILLDLGLPDGSGLQILEQLKKEVRSENVIIISARNEIEDKVAGLDLGADDYNTKPFHLAELNARIKAVLRRKEANGKNNLEFGNLSLDIVERVAFVDNQPIPLNRKEFDILNYFLFNPTRLITRTVLAEHVWGDDIDQADNYDFIYYQIKNIRKKFREAGANVKIEAVYGIGYRIAET